MTRESIETAYCLLHQKLQIYCHSRYDDQRDSIENTVADLVQRMPADLYALLAEGRDDFLLHHPRFEEDLRTAVERLERLTFPQA